MTVQYYYLISSLPGLVFSAPAPVSRNDFIAECRRLLDDRDQAEFDAFMEGRIEDVTGFFSRSYLNADRQMRNAVARARAIRSGVDEKKYLKSHGDFRVDVESAVDDAYSRINPLERELALDRFRWNLADELSRSEPFGLASVLAYGAKLDINAHWQSLTPERGRERLEQLVGIVGVSSDEVAGWSGLAQL
ncbi:MAG TPA: DUF2764 family protein [Kiritimatiellia bacterium]|nr:DUF2764 family protein [Kiritimatiellia bacterium]